MSGNVSGTPRLLLRIESLFVVIGASAAYARTDASCWLFAALFLAPDLSMLGYLVGPHAGAWVYNFGHYNGLPFACMAWGVFGHAPLILAVGLIWAAHIGIDRTLGYGLKYPDGFGVTHLGLIGKARNEAKRSAASHT